MNWIVFGNKIKNYRKANKITQQELANKLEISRSTLSYYERGEVEPNIYTLIKLSNIMNCSVDFLLGLNSNDSTTDHKSIELTNLSNDSINSNIKKLKYLIKKVERTFLELEASKKKTDLMYEELKRSKNRILKFDELFKLLDSLSHSCNDDNNLKFDLEIADQLTPNIIQIQDEIEKLNVDTRCIPLIGKISAGNPCFAYEEIIDTFNIKSSELYINKEYFILRVNGDSMNKLFNNGELILVEQGSVVYDNDLVIALIGDDATFKQIKLSSDEIDLIPKSSNPTHQIQTYKRENVQILGKVLGSLSDFI